MFGFVYNEEWQLNEATSTSKYRVLVTWGRNLRQEQARLRGPVLLTAL